MALGLSLMLSISIAVLWVFSAVLSNRPRSAPGLPARGGLLAAAFPPVALVGLGSSQLGQPNTAIVGSAVMVVVATAVSVVATALRRRRPMRVVVYGDRKGIDAGVRRWVGSREIAVVGACLVEDAPVMVLPEPMPAAPMFIGADCLGELVDETGADLVLVAPGPGASPERIQDAAWQLEHRGVGLALLGPLDAVAPHRLRLSSFAGATLTHVASSRPSPHGQLVKGLLDRLGALLLLVPFLPLIAVLALVVRLDSPGKAIFKQQRVGRDGRLFTMYKLRTMCADAEFLKEALRVANEGDGVLFKMREDPRITRIGRILRKLSLDELPQLFNVLLGTMSLVGPRPALPDEVASYTAPATRRLAVKPGITGLWQVSGRSDLSWDDTIRLDLRYTDNWRLRDDASILVRTARVVLTSRGAY